LKPWWPFRRRAAKLKRSSFTAAYGSDPAPPKDIRGSSPSSDRSQWFPIDRRLLACVADGGDDRVGRWLDEKIDLARIYARI
jgi:hypothetical protein